MHVGSLEELKVQIKLEMCQEHEESTKLWGERNNKNWGVEVILKSTICTQNPESRMACMHMRQMQSGCSRKSKKLVGTLYVL